MKRHLAGVAASVAALLALGAPGGAEAAKWREIAPGQPVSALAGPGAARTGDGVLHVLWPREEGMGGSYQHTAISPQGTSASGPNPVFSFTHGIGRSAGLIVVDGALRAFFSGLMGTTDHPQQIGVETALSIDGGANWAPSPTIVSNNSPGGRSNTYTAGIGAARGSANVPIFAWGDTDPGSAGYHVGLDPADPDRHIGETTACCEYATNVAVDGVTGAAYLAWKFIYGTAGGTASQAIGSAEVLRPPGGAAAEGEIRTAITGRSGAGDFFLAYQRGTNPFLPARPSGTDGPQARPRPAVPAAAQRPGHRHLTGTYRKALGFYRRGSRLYAARSDTHARRFGAIAGVPTPPGDPQLLNLVGEGSDGPLDLIAVFRDSGGSAGVWHRRLLPRLTLAAKVKGHKVTFTVTDAGAKVTGAKVKVAGKSKTTGGSGTASFTLAQPGAYTGKATKNGHSAAKRKVTVKPSAGSASRAGR